MAELLRSGHTMLNLACPICNNPLFRNKDNEILCPICNKRVLVKKDDNNQQISNMSLEKRIINNEKLIKTKINSDIKFKSLKKIIEEKIDYISQKLKIETQIDLIERYVKILTKIYDLLNKIDDNASAGI
ncbi:MAG: hypothetical protein EU529_05810 [Promethearchaeota archaeon]|nr:MAG: hypothetical protein EU529_05810 [Candidatus Lokiarchaeota archaeon]